MLNTIGFGILGHASNLARAQKAAVTLHLRRLPVLPGALHVASTAPGFKFHDGVSAETSGGLLVALPPTAAEAFVRALADECNEPAWIVGDVAARAAGSDVNTASLEGVEFFQVDA